jgi:formate hydrogenlyase maturation protein HycH
MSGSVVFYRLGGRFLDRAQKPPPEAQQVVYYSLAIGHHVGVIDTLSPLLAVPYAGYLAWVASIEEGDAQRKLDGVRRFGEITIDATHVGLLRPALAAALPSLDAEAAGWTCALMDAIEEIAREPAIYLMARRQP